jgi:hypothetical protein
MSNMANDLTPAQKKLFDQLDVTQTGQDNLLKAQDSLLKAQEKITANRIDLINTIAKTLAVEGPMMFTPTATTTTDNVYSDGHRHHPDDVYFDGPHGAGNAGCCCQHILLPAHAYPYWWLPFPFSPV